jgi:hypothetical protein
VYAYLIAVFPTNLADFRPATRFLERFVRDRATLDVSKDNAFRKVVIALRVFARFLLRLPGWPGHVSCGPVAVLIKELLVFNHSVDEFLSIVCFHVLFQIHYTGWASIRQGWNDSMVVLVATVQWSRSLKKDGVETWRCNKDESHVQVVKIKRTAASGGPARTRTR